MCAQTTSRANSPYIKREAIPAVNQRAFTLLEMLVVLIISSAVAALLFQALSQTLQLQSRFGFELFRMHRGTMHADWFRSTVEGLVPDYADGIHQFNGQSKRMHGLTIAPIDHSKTALVEFSWSLEFASAENTTRLNYDSLGTQGTIMSWQGSGGGFFFLDQKGDKHDTWPPLLGKWPQLPSAILLDIPSLAHRGVVIASPRISGVPLERLKDLKNL